MLNKTTQNRTLNPSENSTSVDVTALDINISNIKLNKKYALNDNDVKNSIILNEFSPSNDHAAQKLPHIRHFKDPGFIRNFNSLPLFVYSSELSDSDLVQNSGMDCMPLNSTHHQAAGVVGGGGVVSVVGYNNNYNFHHLNHSHHLIQSDQTKSLQELQNEVGALLEFRDLVIETFPDLKHKMASMSASASTTNTLTGITSNSSLASRREWEPGIRIKRKIGQKDGAIITTSSTSNNAVTNTGATELSSLSRSRSNSHSGKKEPKSGEGNGSVVQDSGFSTETSSSKEAHSASSTAGAMQGSVALNRLLPVDPNDELLNLLDVIHRKSNRLREEFEQLQVYERDNNRTNRISSSESVVSSGTLVSNSNHGSSNGTMNQKMFRANIDRINREDMKSLRMERDRLFDKLAEMEAETLAGRIKATKMNDQMEHLVNVKKDLEEQLKLALSQKLELNARLHELNKQNSSKSSSSQSDSSSHRNFLSSATTVLSTSSTVLPVSSVLLERKPYNSGSGSGGSASGLASSSSAQQMATTFKPVIIESEQNNFYAFQNTTSSDIKQIIKNDLKNLGRLDGLVSTPNRQSKVRVTDSKKIAAILLETNVIELQRHLLTLTVQNQVLMQKLEQTSKSNIFLVKRLGKSKEDVDDLKFQLEEKNIELEGTKAQLRVLEAKMDFHSTISTQETNRSSSTIILTHDSEILNAIQISTPSMKAMIPLQMDEVQHHSSSTESAHDQAERDFSQKIMTTSATMPTSNGQLTPKRITNNSRPSKIPLPGTKGYLAPKPPTGRCTQRSPIGSTIISSSTSATNKSLSRSTGNLFGKSLNSLNRPDSAQSIRKDTSIGTNSRSSTSSIPVSAKTTPSPHKILTNSPLPKLKRDSLTSRVRHLDSLSRVYNNNSNSNNINNNSNIQTSPSSTTFSQNNNSSTINYTSGSGGHGGINATSTPIVASALTSSTQSYLQNNPISSVRNLSSSNNKKDSTSTYNSQGQFLRKQLTSAGSVAGGTSTSNVNIGRRFSSASTIVGRSVINSGVGSNISNSSAINTTAEQQQQQQHFNETDSGKVRNFRSAIWGWLKIQ